MSAVRSTGIENGQGAPQASADIISSLNLQYAQTGDALKVFMEGVGHLKNRFNPEIYDFCVSLIPDLGDQKSSGLAKLRNLKA